MQPCCLFGQLVAGKIPMLSIGCASWGFGATHTLAQPAGQLCIYLTRAWTRCWICPLPTLRVAGTPTGKTSRMPRHIPQIGSPPGQAPPPALPERAPPRQLPLAPPLCLLCPGLPGCRGRSSLSWRPQSRPTRTRQPSPPPAPRCPRRPRCRRAARRPAGQCGRREESRDSRGCCELGGGLEHTELPSGPQMAAFTAGNM
jgi:hypothetical protein